MKLSEIHNVYFIGIGGIGMSALAKWFSVEGKQVAGYDKTPSKITQSLQESAITIHFEENISQIPFEPDLVIYTPAIPSVHLEFQYFLQKGTPILKRAEVLGLISNSKKNFAIAGTHGKTTTSAILAHIYKSCIGDVSAFIGGIMSNYNSNFIQGSANASVVLEADEFDRSFLKLKPTNAVITSADADHLDIYNTPNQLKSSFEDFGALVTNNLLVKKDLELKISGRSKVYSYGIENHADFNVKNIGVNTGKFVFDLEYPTGTINGLELAMPGKHNVENATAAIGLSLLEGIDPKEIKEALSTFKGVKRRFESVVSFKGTTFIDDYAHHPKELDAAISAARELFPDQKITGIFQPHLFTRTRDFMSEFAESLAQLDELWLLDIYPAREEPIDGINSEALLAKVKLASKELVSKANVLEKIQNNPPEVLLTLGAGDIDRLVEPIKTAILQA